MSWGRRRELGREEAELGLGSERERERERERGRAGTGVRERERERKRECDGSWGERIGWGLKSVARMEVTRQGAGSRSGIDYLERIELRQRLELDLGELWSRRRLEPSLC